MAGQAGTDRGSTRHGVEHATARQDAGLRAVHRASAQPDAGADQDDRRPDGVPDPGGGGARAPVPGGGARPCARPAGLAAAGDPARGGAGGGAFAVVRVFLPMVRRVNGFYAAKTIEETDPTFKNSLINYLDLRRHRDSIPGSALAAIEAKAVQDLTHVEIDTVVNQRRLIQMAYLLSRRRGGLLPLRGGDAQEHPRLDAGAPSWPTSSGRPTRGWSTSSPATTPSSRGSSPARTSPSRSTSRGPAPRASCSTTASTAARSSPSRSSPRARTTTTPGRRPCATSSRSVDYYLTGGDAESLRYHLEVLPAPMVTAVALDYDFPALYGPGPPRRDRRGERRGDRGDLGHRPRPDQPARAVGEPQVHQDRPGPDGGRDVRPAGAGREVQGRRVGVVQDRVHDDGGPGQPRARRLRHPRLARQGRRRRSSSGPTSRRSRCRATSRSPW